MLKVRNENDPLGQGMVIMPSVFNCTKFKEAFRSSNRLYQHELGQWTALSSSYFVIVRSMYFVKIK